MKKNKKTLVIAFAKNNLIDRKVIEDEVIETIQFYIKNPQKIPKFQDIRINIELDEKKFEEFKNAVKEKGWTLKGFLSYIINC